MPFPSRYGPVMNAVPWLIESDDEFPSARIKSRKGEKWKTSVREEIFNGCLLDENYNVRLICSFRVFEY